MQRKIALLFFLFSILTPQIFAGSRGVDLAFFDATTGERSHASKRLAELLEKDIRRLFVSPTHAQLFPWSESDLNLTVLNSQKSGFTFDRLLNTKDQGKIKAFFENGKVQDGLIVFFHDQANGFARLKLYGWDGKELLLLRIPLEGKESPMPNSLLKGHREGALVAIGAAVRWSP